MKVGAGKYADISKLFVENAQKCILTLALLHFACLVGVMKLIGKTLHYRGVSSEIIGAIPQKQPYRAPVQHFRQHNRVELVPAGFSLFEGVLEVGVKKITVRNFTP